MPSAQALVAQSFEIVEATIDDIHAAYRAGILKKLSYTRLPGPQWKPMAIRFQAFIQCSRCSG
jgi:hypothetical protein